MTFAESKDALPQLENQYLALKPLLNRSYYSEGVVKLKPEVIARVSRRMSGVNNPFYGKTHSDEMRLSMSLNHPGRKEIYQYTLDYVYTGKSALSLQKSKDIGAKYTGAARVTENGGSHRGFRYSLLAPVLDPTSGNMVLPVEGRVLNPLRGTGSSRFKPIKVTRSGSDLVQYFVGLRRAITVIKEHDL